MITQSIIHALVILIEGIATIMLADFVAGIVHWLQDAYGTEETPVVGPLLIRINIVHHHYPRFFTRLTWWQSSWDLLLIGAALLAAAWWAGLLTWQVWLFAIVSVNANQVHKWAHRTRTENGPVISFLQDIRVLLTPHQHAIHHTDPKNTFYCPVTNLVNPLLERLRFWTRVEIMIWRATGRRHRRDTSNRGKGPGPNWLSAYRAPGLKDNFPALVPTACPRTESPAPAKPQCVGCRGTCRSSSGVSRIPASSNPPLSNLRPSEVHS
jgi:ubiquitin-conjugating enzyme E2 variant